MFGRCAERTRYRRFHGPARAIPARYLAEALSGDPDHYAVVACAPIGAITALASCRTVAPGMAELGILVEDASQGQGLGRLLLRTLVLYAERSGLTLLHAAILREQPWIIRMLREYGRCETVSAGEAVEVTLRVLSTR